jgi:hypothetical protein
MRNKNETKSAFPEFVRAIREHLVLYFNWSEDEARNYVREPDQFKGAWIEGLTASKVIEDDLGLFIEHESQYGDGEYA